VREASRASWFDQEIWLREVVSSLHLVLVLKGHSLREVLSGSLQSIKTPADGRSRRPDKTQ
jgi:hypothetical protein